MVRRPFNEDLVTVTDAAEMLGISRTRVRALLEAGQLSGFKRETIWFLSSREIWQRASVQPLKGRPFEPINAWALLALVSEATGEVSGIMAGVSEWKKRYLRSRLRREGFAQLAPRLVHRAKRCRFWVHPAELPRVSAEDSLVHSGVSLAERIGTDLLIGDEVEGYVSAEGLRHLVQMYSMAEFARQPNVILHVADPWPFVAGLKEVPTLVTAVDMLESEDARTRGAGQQIVSRLAITEGQVP